MLKGMWNELLWVIVDMVETFKHFLQGCVGQTPSSWEHPGSAIYRACHAVRAVRTEQATVLRALIARIQAEPITAVSVGRNEISLADLIPEIEIWQRYRVEFQRIEFEHGIEYVNGQMESALTAELESVFTSHGQFLIFRATAGFPSWIAHEQVIIFCSTNLSWVGRGVCVHGMRNWVRIAVDTELRERGGLALTAPEKQKIFDEVRSTCSVLLPTECPQCQGKVRQMGQSYYCLECEWDDLEAQYS